MQQKMFKDKYPIFSLEFSKAESKFATTPAIIEYLHGLIEADPKAVNIAIFDHYTHTKSVDGVINPEISDAQNINFLFWLGIAFSRSCCCPPTLVWCD